MILKREKEKEKEKKEVKEKEGKSFKRAKVSNALKRTNIVAKLNSARLSVFCVCWNFFFYRN